ncbi:MAG: hypothetical protein GQ546_14060 [Gammaproteobacteria bacterium]|nr:hypothetical protein [Gammaproteobacteria bacterium]
MKSLIGWVKSKTNSKTQLNISIKPEPSVTVDSSEIIARFLTSSSHVAKSKGRIKYASYLPAPDGETSVYRVSGISNHEIDDIGDKYVREPRIKNGGKCTIHGWSEVEAIVILNTKIIIEPKTIPHARHANLKNWLDTRIERIKQATDIANKATYHNRV